MKTFKAIPTKSYKGFIAGTVYQFEQIESAYGELFKTVSPDGSECIECLDGSRSAHLWDGKNWDMAGEFLVIPNVRISGKLNFGVDHGFYVRTANCMAEKLARAYTHPKCREIYIGRNGTGTPLSICLLDDKANVLRRRAFKNKEEIMGFLEGFCCEVF